jgi:hypothetical protein
MTAATVSAVRNAPRMAVPSHPRAAVRVRIAAQPGDAWATALLLGSCLFNIDHLD